MNTKDSLLEILDFLSPYWSEAPHYRVLVVACNEQDPFLSSLLPILSDILTDIQQKYTNVLLKEKIEQLNQLSLSEQNEFWWDKAHAENLLKTL